MRNRLSLTAIVTAAIIIVASQPEPAHAFGGLQRRLFRGFEFAGNHLFVSNPQNGPFFDENIFPELVEAIYADTLGLSAEQLADLTELSYDVRSNGLSGFDPEDGLPVEAFLARERMIEELESSMSGIVDTDQLERLESVATVARGIMEGNRETP